MYLYNVKYITISEQEGSYKQSNRAEWLFFYWAYSLCAQPINLYKLFFHWNKQFDVFKSILFHFYY
jgi:hypothetical protein